MTGSETVFGILVWIVFPLPADDAAHVRCLRLPFAFAATLLCLLLTTGIADIAAFEPTVENKSKKSRENVKHKFTLKLKLLLPDWQSQSLVCQKYTEMPNMVYLDAQFQSKQIQSVNKK